MSCSIVVENFESFEPEASSQRLCELNIMGRNSPISWMIFLERSSRYSSCGFASSPSSSSESFSVAALLFLAKRERNLLYNVILKVLIKEKH